jgi:hypothetical protein
MFNGLITKTIAFEIGFNKMITSTSFGIHFELTYRNDRDHKGFFSSFYLWKYGFEFNVYSTLHEDNEDWRY